MILVKGEFIHLSTYFCGFLQSWGTDAFLKEFSAFLDMRRYKNWAHKMSKWRPVLPVFQSTEGLIPDLHPDLPSGVWSVESQGCSTTCDCWNCCEFWEPTVWRTKLGQIQAWHKAKRMPQICNWGCNLGHKMPCLLPGWLGPTSFPFVIKAL